MACIIQKITLTYQNLFDLKETNEKKADEVEAVDIN
jgi:hypothetical protein